MAFDYVSQQPNKHKKFVLDKAEGIEIMNPRIIWT